MKKVFAYILATGLFAGVCSSGTAQIYTYTNDLGGVLASVAANATGANLTRTNGALNPIVSCLSGFNSRGFSATTTYLPSLAAIQFSVTPNAGYQLNVQAFTIQNRRNATGPAYYRLAYSIDGGSTWINNGSNYNPPTGSCDAMTTLTWDMADFSHNGLVRFRIYGFNAISILGVNQLKNITIQGTVTPTTVLGCTDPVACNYNPLANTDDGSCIYPGCTNVAACNYNPAAACDDGSCVLVGSACDDGDPYTSGDIVHGDCGCLGIPTNDEKVNAVPITQSIMGTCDYGIALNLQYATTSANSMSTAITGEDLWYSFVSATSAVRVEATGGTCNVVIELQNSAGTMLDQENVTGVGSPEYMNKDNLVEGTTYYIVVRNYNSGTGTGWVDLCVTYVPDSRIDNPIPLYTNTCNTAKADWTGAYSYEFVFTNLTSLAVTSLVKTGTTVFTISSAPGMEWDESYNVAVNPTYHLFDAIGGMESIYVLSDEITVMNIGLQPLMAIRAVDQCADGPNLLGSSIAGEPFVCMSTDYQWEFTRTDIAQAPIYKLRGAANRFLVLNTVPGLVGGATYDVRVRPIFSYGSGNWGDVKCMSTVGTSSLIVDGSDEITQEAGLAMAVLPSTDIQEIGLSPNPSDGRSVNLTLESSILNHATEIACYDVEGRCICRQQITDHDGTSIVMAFPSTLDEGIYVITLTGATGKIYTGRLVVTR